MKTTATVLLLLGCMFRLADALHNKSFPQNFLLGVATASYQIEGSWNVDGKGESIWDHLTHYRSHLITDQSNGDIACDSYKQYLTDIENLKYLGVDFYRFSLAWTRILPTGLKNNINQKGIDYYNKVINELIANGITPMVTLYHWDLPQYLQNLGGWTNSRIVKYFTDFAQIAFSEFGDRVKIWTTINEPRLVCQHGYGGVLEAPAINSRGIGEYLCVYNLLKAHASVYHLYNSTFRSKQSGKIGIVLESFFAFPASNDPKDLAAADRQMQFTLGMYGHPIFHPDGNYPQVVIDRIANRSAQEGFSRSRLPALTKNEVDYIKGTSDFFGLNHYSSEIVKDREEFPIGDPSFEKDTGIHAFQDASWPGTIAPWLKVVPHGFRQLLIWIKDSYGNPDIFVTENGCVDSGEMNDYGRIDYFQKYMDAMLLAMNENGVNVIGYAAWCLMDVFEWMTGYTYKFGLFGVDFNHENRTRTIKESAKFYKNVLATRCLADNGCL